MKGSCCAEAVEDRVGAGAEKGREAPRFVKLEAFRLAGSDDPKLNGVVAPKSKGAVELMLSGVVELRFRGVLVPQLRGVVELKFRGALEPKLRGALLPQLSGAVEVKSRGALGARLRGVLFPQLMGVVEPKLTLVPRFKGVEEPKFRGVVEPKLRGVVDPRLKGVVAPKFSGADRVEELRFREEPNVVVGAMGSVVLVGMVAPLNCMGNDPLLGRALDVRVVVPRVKGELWVTGKEDCDKIGVVVAREVPVNAAVVGLWKGCGRAVESGSEVFPPKVFTEKGAAGKLRDLMGRAWETAGAEKGACQKEGAAAATAPAGPTRTGGPTGTNIVPTEGGEEMILCPGRGKAWSIRGIPPGGSCSPHPTPPKGTAPPV